MLVYRVEHAETRLGPYATPEPHGLHYAEANVTQEHPAHDRSERVGVWWYGFENKTQLSRWFSVEQRCRLSQQGFVLSVYEADPRSVIADTRKTQVIFSGGNRVNEVNLSPTEEI